MIVEINLLGKPEKRNMAPLVIFAIFLFLILGLGLYGFTVHQKNSTELATLEQKLQTTKQLIQINEQKSITQKSTTSIDDLKTTIEWAETFPTPTVYLIRHLTSLLPERGYIMNFSYSDDGTLSLTVQTDTSRELAYYLKALIDSPFLTEVNLNSITTAETELMQTQIANGEVTETKIEGEYVPRYLGQFELKINKNALKVEAAKEENEQ